MASGFDMKKSAVSADTLTEFLRGRLEEDIASVPGIGAWRGTRARRRVRS